MSMIIKISHLLLTTLASFDSPKSWYIYGPDFLQLQKLGHAQLTWHDTRKNTQQNRPHHHFFWLPNVHIREFIMTTVKNTSKSTNKLKFCLISTLGPWRPRENSVILCWCRHPRKKIFSTTNTIPDNCLVRKRTNDDHNWVSVVHLSSGVWVTPRYISLCPDWTTDFQTDPTSIIVQSNHCSIIQWKIRIPNISQTLPLIFYTHGLFSTWKKLKDKHGPGSSVRDLFWMFYSWPVTLWGGG